MEKATNKHQAGFTLIELMLAISIVGVLATIALQGVRSYMASAKTTEARSQVGHMARLALAAYEREKADATVLTPGQTSTSAVRSFCGSSNPVPATPPVNRKYQSSPRDWTSPNMAVGWNCLKFSIEGPQYYTYQYTASDGGFSSIAHGDLNGDGVRSTFVLRGEAEGTMARLAAAIEEVNPDE